MGRHGVYAEGLCKFRNCHINSGQWAPSLCLCPLASSSIAYFSSLGAVPAAAGCCSRAQAADEPGRVWMYVREPPQIKADKLKDSSQANLGNTYATGNKGFTGQQNAKGHTMSQAVRKSLSQTCPCKGQQGPWSRGSNTPSSI